jgi:hypothetical protein
VSLSSIPKLTIRRGVIRMIAESSTSPAAPRWPSPTSACSAVPRISKHRTRHGSRDAMSSTTKATRLLVAMLRNFWLCDIR